MFLCYSDSSLRFRESRRSLTEHYSHLMFAAVIYEYDLIRPLGRTINLYHGNAAAQAMRILDFDVVMR